MRYRTPPGVGTCQSLLVPAYADAGQIELALLGGARQNRPSARAHSRRRARRRAGGHQRGLRRLAESRPGATARRSPGAPAGEPGGVEKRDESGIDALNLARVFPGSYDGSATQRIGYALTARRESNRAT